MAYLDKVAALYKAGNATEHSYRPALKDYIESLLPGITATNEPKRQKCGAPDYIITRHTRGADIDIGYIEAKDVGKNLDEVEKGEQFTRYKESLDNLILTDYLDFRFFKEGKKVAEIRIAHALIGQIQPLPENLTKLETLLKDFAAFQGQTITSAKTLAIMMARKAKMMQDVFYKALLQEEVNTGLNGQLQAFRQILIHDMKVDEFADVYAQTITYGLFTARLHDETLEDFSRQEALELIPMSNPFLRKLFQYVALELDDSVAWIVDALCEVFRATNIRAILEDFGRQTGRNDPIVHFYETFLAEYNPKLRKSRGVWYTPEPVVNFIIRAVDDCLKMHFNLPMGLADTSKVKIKAATQAFDKRTKTGKALVEKEVHKVQLLDVATGTGTFIAEVVKQIYNGHFQHQQGMWSNYVEEHLLPRLHGFEILMASYAMCHMKIDLLLRETGYKPKNHKKPPRLSVYLTNSLEEAHPDAETLFASWLATEANEANVVKRETPVMVAFGNPPYSGHSSNKTILSDKLLEDYKKEPTGGKLKEKNSKWLNDDYVKFLRIGEYYVERNGEGILAYITNHGYLDNPTFRGMRWHLLNTFDDIYILDLHGNAKKKEASPDGTPDKNVFDIQQGVSIIIAAKHGKRKGKLAEVHHLDMWGSRPAKYERLWACGIERKDFTTLTPYAPNYLFIPFNDDLEKHYRKGFSANKIFPINGNGIVTKRDNLCIQSTPDAVWESVNDFIHKEEAFVRSKYLLPEDVRDWRYSWAVNDLKENHDRANIQRINYRPFDVRYIFYTGKSRGFVGWPVQQIMKNYICHKNYGLLAPKALHDKEFAHCFITDKISEAIFLSGTTGSNAMNFPLYLYPTEDDQLTLGGKQQRTPNLDTKIIAQISKKLGIPFVPDHDPENLSLRERSASTASRVRAETAKPSPQPSPEGRGSFNPLDVLDYIYAVLHSPTYRATYKEFLKIDFPRVPYPDNVKTFWQLVGLGREVRLLHLLESPILSKFITKYPVSGDNRVDKPAYVSGKVYINKDQYFDGVPEMAWNFYIGGYQPAQKWLKDRKGRTLNFEDITHYQKIIIALTNTDRLMKEIDVVWKP